MTRYGMVQTAAGWAALVERDGKVLGVVLPAETPDHAHAQVAEGWPNARYDPATLAEVQSGIRDYFAGQPVKFNAPLDLSDLPPFRRRVLEACQQIPYGQRRTYGDLARQIGRPRAARAVGQALGRNPIPLLVPCHRVVQSDGGLGGFSSPSGPQQKAELLRLESQLTGATR